MVLLTKYTCAAYDCFCAPGSHIHIKQRCYIKAHVLSIQQASSLMSWAWTDPVRPSAPITPDTSLKVRWSSCACNVSGVSSWTRDVNIRTHSSSDLQDICGFSCDDLSSMFKELKGLGVVVKQLSNELRQVVRIESSCLCDVDTCMCLSTRFLL